MSDVQNHFLCCVVLCSTFYLKNQGFGYFEEYLAPFGTVNLIWQHFSPQKVINFFLRYHVMKFEVDWLRFSLFSRGGGLPEPPPVLARPLRRQSD